MKQGLGIKAGIIGLAVLSAGAAVAVPVSLPQTAVTAEAAQTSSVTVKRQINIYKKYSDGKKEKVGEVGQESSDLLDKDRIVDFPASDAKEYLSGFDDGAWGAWIAEEAKVPAASGSYNNPPAAYDMYLVLDSSKGLTANKTIKRTIEYYTEDANGKRSLSSTSMQNVTFPAGTLYTEKYTFSDVTVPVKTGYTADRTVIKGKTVTPKSGDFTEKVIYKKNPDVKTEEKTVWRKINFIDKDTGKQIKGSQSNGVKFSREVYTDANGKTVVVRDWQAKGTIQAVTVPDIEGYSHTQKTVPAVTVKPSDKDFEVNVEYTSTRFTVNYHLDDKSAASAKKTVVDYGTWTKTLTTSELKFSKANHTFVGWKAYREIDDKWYVKDSNGNYSFVKLVKGKLPAGYEYVIYRDGTKVRTVAKRGNVHFYGQWQENKFTVNYHLDDNSNASSQKTDVVYGNWTKTLTVKELGFSKSGKTFVGWKAYREIDDKWYVKDASGNYKFVKLVNGKLPSGYTFAIYKNGTNIRTFAKSGNVHFYGQWK